MQVLKVDRQTVSHASLKGGQTNYPITDKQYSMQVCDLTIRLQTQKVDIYIFLFKLISLYF